MSEVRTPILWFVVDGLPHWLVQRSLDEGGLGALSALAGSRNALQAYPSRPNCQTPPGLATLFTGCTPAEHGIAGFRIGSPDRTDDLLRTRSGFDADLLRVPPLWERLEDRDCSVALAHVPWTTRRSGDPGRADYSAFRELSIAPQASLLEELPKAGGGWHVFHTSADGPPIRLRLEDGVPIAQCDGQETRLDREEAGGWVTSEIDLGAAGRVSLHVWPRPVDGALVALHLGASRASAGDELAERVRLRSGAFACDAPRKAYRSGVFGPRLGEGGDGGAESMLTRAVDLAGTFFAETALEVMASAPGRRLYVIYQPCFDSIAHELIGWCNTENAADERRPQDVASRCIAAIVRRVDRQLQRARQLLPAGAPVVLSSDHGMTALSARFHPNEVLREAGLLEFDERGGIDLRRTRVLYHPANNGSCWVNDVRRRAGTVSSILPMSRPRRRAA